MSDKVEFVAGGGALDPRGLRPSIGGSSHHFIVNREWGLGIDVGVFPQSRAARKREAEKILSIVREKPKTEFRTLSSGLVKVATLNRLVEVSPDSDYLLPTNYSDCLPNCRALEGIKNLFFLISHGHADHAGAAPWAKRQFPNAKFLMTEETLQISRWQWQDYLKIVRAENMRRKKEHKPLIHPIFTGSDVERLLKDVIIIRAGERMTIGPFELNFFHAGHIIGAVSVFIKTLTTPPITIFHSCDISFDDRYILHGAPRLDYQVLGGRPDYLIMETTNGNSDPVSQEEVEKEMVDDIVSRLENGGKVLLPSLAVGRSQKNFSILNRYGIVARWPSSIHIDGSAREISRIHMSYSLDPAMSDVESYFVEDEQQRERIISSDGPELVIVPSGMLHGGYAVRYASAWAGDPKNLFAFTCFQEQCSPGYRLLNTPQGTRVNFGDKRDRQRTVTLNATVKKYPMSGHASRVQLLQMKERLEPGHTFFVHGDVEAMDRMTREAAGSTIKTVVGERYTLL